MLALSLLAPTTKAESPSNLYILHCAGCHGLQGAGSVQGGIPDFRNYVASFSYLPEGRRYVMQVPGVLISRLDNTNIATVMNYVMTQFGGASLQADFQPFDANEVASLRQNAIADVVQYRRELVKAMHAEQLPVAAYPWP